MPENLVSVKSVVDNLEKDVQIPIGYVSFRQGYLQGKLNQNVKKHIVEIKKFTSTSYYIREADIDKFSDALVKQFN